MMGRLSRAAVALAMVCGTLAHGQEKGGTPVPSTQDGLWSAGTTWVGGVSPTDVVGLNQALVLHTVEAATAGQSAGSINVGHSAGAGTLNITGGALDSLSGVVLGFTNPGIVNMSGGMLTPNIMFVGANSEFNISAGRSLMTDPLRNCQFRLSGVRCELRAALPRLP